MSEAPSLDEIQLINFKLGESEFGVDILQVKEIVKMAHITTIPTAPIFVDGVINLRGQICTIIDLRTRLGLDKIPITDNTSIILVELLEDTPVGMIVDSLSGVIRVRNEQIEYNPSLVADNIDAKYIRGVAKQDERLIILLDLKKILKSHELDKLAELTEQAAERIEKEVRSELKKSDKSSKDKEKEKSLEEKEKELKEKEKQLKELEEREKRMEENLKKDMEKIEEQRKLQLELEQHLLESMEKKPTTKKKKK